MKVNGTAAVLRFKAAQQWWLSSKTTLRQTSELLGFIFQKTTGYVED